jgi:hypothetical protein
MSTAEERRRIWREEQAAAERRRIWRQEQTQPPASQQPGMLETFAGNISNAAQQGYVSLKDKAAALGEIVGGIAGGDFRPAIEAGQRIARGAYPIVTALGRPDAGPTYLSQSVAQAGPIAEVKARSDARRAAAGDTSFSARAEEMRRLEAEAQAFDSSLPGRLTRGVVREGIKLAPTLIAGAVSGGSVPAIAATTALSSFDQPENLITNTALSSLPAPAVGKFIAPVLRRIRAGRAAGAAPRADDLAEAAIRSRASLPRLEADLGVSGAPTSPIRSTGAVAERAASARGPAAERANFSLADDDLAAIGRAGEELATRAERTRLLEVVSAARKAGLLTSAKTHIKNVVGTGGFQLSEEVARIPGAIVDTLVSRVTKQRALTGPSLGSMRRSAQEAATKGWQEAKEIWRNGITQADVERLGLNQEINSGSKILDAYINKTFRSLSVEDKLLNTYATRRALEDRARSLALTEMRQGKISQGEVGRRTMEIIKQPPEDLAAAAIADGEIAVFTNDNLVSKFLGAGRKEIEKLPGGRTATFGLDLVFPFTKTPTNVIARLLDYAGLGAAKETTKAIARRIVGKSMTAEQQRQFATQWGRASVGAGLVTLGYIGYRNGWLTGFTEDDPGRRERDEASGRIPGAILIGGRWHQILGAAPLASLMVIGATLGREVDQEREGSSGLMPVLETIGQSVSEQPLLIGTKQVGEAVTKPGTTGERLLGGLAGSFVPTFVSDIAEAFDPLQRDTRGAGILGAAQKRIPGARNLLPEAQDVLGRPRQDRGPLGALFDPTRATDDATRDNAVLRELVRLDVGLSAVSRRDGESVAEHRARIQEFGKLYTLYGAALISDPQYNQASDKTKREALAALNRKLRSLLGEDEGQAPSRLNAPAVFDSVKRSEERRREKERKKQGR